jgi:hypothetical protein
MIICQGQLELLTPASNHKQNARNDKLEMDKVKDKMLDVNGTFSDFLVSFNRCEQEIQRVESVKYSVNILGSHRELIAKYSDRVFVHEIKEKELKKTFLKDIHNNVRKELGISFFADQVKPPAVELTESSQALTSEDELEMKTPFQKRVVEKTEEYIESKLKKKKKDREF